METQSSSKARVKEDGIGEDRMKLLYTVFQSASVDDFRKMCLEAIEASNGKPETKIRFSDALNRLYTKAPMLQKVTNYFLAGEGKGV